MMGWNAYRGTNRVEAAAGTVSGEARDKAGTVRLRRALWRRGHWLGVLGMMVIGVWCGGAVAAEEYSTARGDSSQNVGRAVRATVLPALPKTLDDLQRVTGEDFICMSRDNFLIASDLEFDEAEYVVDGVFDFCRRALLRLYFDKAPANARTVNLYVFRDYTSYATGLRRFLSMDPISPYGHYGHSQKYLVINYDTGPGTLVHEMTHALMADDFPEAPIWIAEGMASLYEQCRAEGTILRGEDNWRLPELKSAVSRGTMTPLGRLFTMTPSAFRAQNESLHYAQARYFCKYLEELGLLPAIYREFRSRYQQDPTGARFVVQAFGKPLDAIDAAWQKWITYQHWSEN